MTPHGLRSLGAAGLLLLSAGCSSSSAPHDSVTLMPSYHLRMINGALLPISETGGTVDSGHVRRLGGDTIYIDRISHTPPSASFPGTITIAHGTWLASQSGSIVVLHPVLASEQDTAFVSRDTLTVHAYGQAYLYVAP